MTTKTKTPPKKVEEQTKQVNIQMPIEMYEKIKNLGKSNGFQTVSTFVRYTMAQTID